MSLLDFFGQRRRSRYTDVWDVEEAGFRVEEIEGGVSRKLHVEFHGPPESLYSGRFWTVEVELRERYPPRINFFTSIYHPNICKKYGYIAYKEQKWSPDSDLVKIFQVFLPKLLLIEPNPKEVMNVNAAYKLLTNKEAYERKVKEHCANYAEPEDKAAVENDWDRSRKRMKAKILYCIRTIKSV